MNKFFLFALMLLMSIPVMQASTTKKASSDMHSNNFVRGYGNSFIFVEGGIEFSVFILVTIMAPLFNMMTLEL